MTVEWGRPVASLKRTSHKPAHRSVQAAENQRPRAVFAAAASSPGQRTRTCPPRGRASDATLPAGPDVVVDLDGRAVHAAPYGIPKLVRRRHPRWLARAPFFFFFFLHSKIIAPPRRDGSPPTATPTRKSSASGPRRGRRVGRATASTRGPLVTEDLAAFALRPPPRWTGPPTRGRGLVGPWRRAGSVRLFRARSRHPSTVVPARAARGG